VKQIGPDVLAPENRDRIAEFVRRAVATGKVLDAKDDRAAAQGLINFWVARLAAAARTAERKGTKEPEEGVEVPCFDDTLLFDFDPDTVRSAAAEADAWLQTLVEAERSLPRCLMLKLVRLRSDVTTFDPIPTVRAALYTLDTPENVDAAIAGLVAAGVVRVRPGETPEMDRVALRSPDLITEWKTFAGWLRERVQFREHVNKWDQARRQANQLFEGDHLREVRTYHDRNRLERQFTDRSRDRERRRNEWNRVLKWVFLGLALAILCGWITALFYYHAASAEREVASDAREARIKAEAALQEARAEFAEKEKLTAKMQQDILSKLLDAREIAALGPRERAIAIDMVAEAINTYQQHVDGEEISQRPFNAFLHSKLAQMYTEDDKYDEAIKQYELAAKYDPTDLNPYWGLGTVYHLRGEYERAISQYKEALKLNDNGPRSAPFAAELHLMQSHAYIMEGRYKEANDEIDRAIGLNTNNTDIFNTRGYIQLAQGDLEKASPQFQKAIELDKRNYNAYLNLGLKHALQGHMDEARDDWRKGLRLCQGSSRVARMLRALYSIAMGDAVIEDTELPEILEKERPGRSDLQGVFRDAQLIARSQRQVTLPVLGTSTVGLGWSLGTGPISAASALTTRNVVITRRAVRDEEVEAIVRMFERVMSGPNGPGMK
jgi:tetratricopeptide (TPR) repeat protein